MVEEVEEKSCEQGIRKIEGEIEEAYGAQKKREFPKEERVKGQTPQGKQLQGGRRRVLWM